MTLAEALNSNTSAARLAEILDLNNQKICQAIATNPNTSPKVLLELFKNYPLEVLKNPSLNLILLEIPDFLEQLLSASYLFLRRSKDLPPFILEAAINHPEPKIQHFLILECNLPEYYLKRLLFKLANNEYSIIRKLVAENKNTPISLLKKLANDRNSDVRISAVRNRNMPTHFREKILKELASDRNSKVRISVAQNKHTPISLLEKLASDRNSKVRISVAENKHTPIYLLEELASDRNSEVRISVVHNRKTPIYLLEKLANDENGYLLQSIAARPNIPIYLQERMIEKLAETPEDEIRYYLTLNPNLPIHIVQKLAMDRSARVCYSIVKHPKIDSKTIELLFEKKQFKPNDRDREEIIDAIELEIKRLNWTSKRARQYLNEKYGRSKLGAINNQELFEFWQDLASLECKTYPTSLQPDVFDDLEDIMILN